MSKLKPPHDPIEALGEAYELMLERVTEDLRKVEDKTEPMIHRLVDKAREKAVELGELTREEADRVAGYLKRDLDDLGRYLAETGRELEDWLGFETGLIEAELLQMLMDAADQTQLEWIRLRLEARLKHPVYKTGEVAAPGTFVCLKCGEKIHLHRIGHLPPCPKCGHTEFRRESFD